MGRLLTRLAREERAQELIEYAMLATVISLASIFGVRALELALANVFRVIAGQLR